MNFKLSEIVKVKSEFGRSVNLERDFYTPASMDGYVLTTTGLTSLERIAHTVDKNSQAKAWTITGAYGSGKSAFALFAAKLLNRQTGENTSLSEMLPKKGKGSFSHRVFVANSATPRFIPILVSGSREPLHVAILRGIRAALLNSDSPFQGQLIEEVDRLESSPNITGKGIVKLLHSIASIAGDQSSVIGVLIVIDELGKLLEFAALNPEQSDIFILQELAEASKNSVVPLLVITILHQAFERYAERLGKRERDEWAKIQARFEDIPFQEPNDQLLHILSGAITHNRRVKYYQTISERGQLLADQACKLGLCGLIDKREALSLLTDCMPLHPLVSLLLGTIFRRFGQNERSLFAFLTSSEPFSFTEFIQEVTWCEDRQSVVGLDYVYDYLVAAMGNALIAGPEGRKWAEVDAALHRLPDASLLETRVLKTIGLLYLLGDLGKFKCSRELLNFALVDQRITSNDVDLAIEHLLQKSVITERKFNDTLVIWEGSDVDLDERFAEAERQNDRNFSLADGLRNHFFQPPIVAKRHSYRTGTLRYFEVVFANIEDLMTAAAFDQSKGDGQIFYVLSTDRKAISLLEEKIRVGEFNLDPRTIIAIPKNLENLRESIWRTICWRWVLSNTPQLENDRAARKELRARLAQAEEAVSGWLEEWHGNTTSPSCAWFWKGNEIRFARARNLQTFLSSVFDDVFFATPILKNELINRRVLSSAATSARRSLFESMISQSDHPQLGITGYPPQLSMYFSLFQETTIHRKEKGEFGFFPPRDDSDKGIQLVWEEIENFLDRTTNENLTVGDLFDRLQKAPYGLKAGLLPLLVASALIYFDAEVALYERGSFLPKLTLPVFERLCRSPESFRIQLCRISGVRSTLLARMAEVLLPDRTDTKDAEILTLVRPLARFAQELGEYSQHTTRVSMTARKIRRALFSAREPDKLIFKFLPEACGISEFGPDISRDEGEVEEFLHLLYQGLAELKRSYSELLNEIDSMLISAFSLSERSARAELERRCRATLEYASSTKLKGFILRVSDAKTDRVEWLESIAAHVAGKPPAFWRDEDIAKFEVGLAEIARSFLNLESLVFERIGKQDLDGSIELIRLNFAQIEQGERSRVVSVRSEDREIINEAVQLLRSAFESSRINGNSDLRLATLAQLSLELLKETEG
jgi:hypothetical protein